ncbi:MAG: hypothetical protein CMK89_09020 [Pseudomonadales bacterium]|nr:hypothetical protein [Pseudomonadales bacterium]RLU00050.1 MAG: hypothetical protein D9N11_13170 [Ketobacter sp.]
MSKKIKLSTAMAIPLVAAVTSVAPQTAFCDFFISSFGTNELMRFNEDTGEYLGVIAEVQGPFASQIGFEGDLFVSSFHTGEVLRFDSDTGDFIGVFIQAGAGGLTNPTAPNFGPDGKVYVGDLASNRVLRYNKHGEFLDVFADGETSDLNGPFMQTFDDTTMYIASGYDNSILRYDLKTKEYMGRFVASGSGGLKVPVGLEFGPDGNLYTSSSATSAILRYDGLTGDFIDEFVPPGGGGMSSPRAIRFGGANSDLYVISSDTNEVLQFDRETGAFVGIIADSDESGMAAARGLTFTPRPEFFVYANVAEEKKDKYKLKAESDKDYRDVKISRRLKDYSDPSPKVELISISSSDSTVNIDDAVVHAKYGMEDYHFTVDFSNKSGVTQYYNVTYHATNQDGEMTIASTRIPVPAK